MLLEQIIMRCFSNIRAERSSAAIYHLITGKRSVQTIQDARLFCIEDFYRIHRKLTKDSFKNTVKQLIQQNLLETIDNALRDDHYVVTTKGEQWITENNDYKIYYFKGSLYSPYDQIFLSRLYLSIQTFSNTARDHYNFIPIIDEKNCEHWVKQLYKIVRGKEKVYLEKLYNEVEPLLGQFKVQDAELFVERLTAYFHYGKSIDQLATSYTMNYDDVLLSIHAIAHKIIDDINRDPKKYPILSYYIKEEMLEVTLSKSATRTYQLLKANRTIEEIAVRRQLKINTVYDHIVEIALNDQSFLIEPYIKNDQIIEIKAALQKVNGYKLKMIKDYVNENITFFQIRLVIAKYGNE